MNVTPEDLWWLRLHYPLLSTRLSTSRVMGTLEVSAYYDKDAHRIFTSRHLGVRSHDTFIADHFSIEVDFEREDMNGWPTVYEIGMRHQSIAKRYKIPKADLHFYPTGAACLGLRYPWESSPTLEQFVADIVEPFFYRLAYVDLYGLSAARADLWPEYSHDRGLIEYREDVRRGALGLSII